jgi:hypothetical protein
VHYSHSWTTHPHTLSFSGKRAIKEKVKAAHVSHLKMQICLEEVSACAPPTRDHNFRVRERKERKALEPHVVNWSDQSNVTLGRPDKLAPSTCNTLSPLSVTAERKIPKYVLSNKT